MPEASIILVDDGSTDTSGELCDKFAMQDERIRVIHKPNGKLVSARKAGVSTAKGEYIGYVDGDDWIDPDMYMQMYENGIYHGVDIISIEDIREYSDGSGQVETIFFEEGVYREKEEICEIVTSIISTDRFFKCNVPLHAWQHLYRRELLIRNQLRVDDRVRRSEDACCVLPCFLEANSVSFIHKSLYHFRQNSESLRYSSSHQDAKGILYLYQRLLNAAKECSMNTDTIW